MYVVIFHRILLDIFILSSDESNKKCAQFHNSMEFGIFWSFSVTFSWFKVATSVMNFLKNSSGFQRIRFLETYKLTNLKFVACVIENVSQFRYNRFLRYLSMLLLTKSYYHSSAYNANYIKKGIKYFLNDQWGRKLWHLIFCFKSSNFLYCSVANQILINSFVSWNT